MTAIHLTYIQYALTVFKFKVTALVFCLAYIHQSFALYGTVVQIEQYKESFQSRKQSNRNFNNVALWIDHARVSCT